MTSATGPGSPYHGRSPDRDEMPIPFGSYLLLRAFARGGMGEVYLARYTLSRPDGGLGDERYGVLKKLRPELTKDQEYVRRFIDEARIVVQLHHPNICHVFDVGRVGDEYYLAMEYVSGRDVRTLQDRARDHDVQLPVPVVLHLLCEVLEALDYAHGRNHPVSGEPLNLIHRDVSPQNVMVSFEGAVKLIDFGLASSKLKMERTQPNVVMGKMAYMAPEQARGEPIDSRVDLFAAGVLGYELLVGERYYEDMSAHEIWSVVGRGDFVPRKWKTIEPELARILAQGLHPKADKRFATCSDFRQALLFYLDKHYPGTGPEHLCALVEELFPEEIAREREMLQGFTRLDSDTLSESLEASRSMSVSLAHADFVGPPTVLDGAVPGSRVARDELTSSSEDMPTPSAERRGSPAPTPSPQGPSTPPTGTLSRDFARAAERTEVVQRAPGFVAPRREKSRVLPLAAAAGLLIAAIAGAALFLGREETTPAPAHVSAPEARPVAAPEVERPAVPVAAEPPAPARRKVRAPKRPARVEPVAVAEREPRASAEATPARAERAPPARDDRKKPKSVRRTPPKEKEREVAPPKPRVPRVDPKLAELRRKSPEERAAAISSCDACKGKVFDELVKLRTKEKTVSGAEWTKARREFDAVWERCYRRCR